MVNYSSSKCHNSFVIVMVWFLFVFGFCLEHEVVCHLHLIPSFCLSLSLPLFDFLPVSTWSNRFNRLQAFGIARIFNVDTSTYMHYAHVLFILQFAVNFSSASDRLLLLLLVLLLLVFFKQILHPTKDLFFFDKIALF